MKKISVIGAGSWGTTLANLLATKGFEVSLWAREEDLVEDINTKHENTHYLEGKSLSSKITATNSLEDCLTDTNLVVVAVPSTFTRSVLAQCKEFIHPEAPIIHVVKGMEESTGKLISQVIAEELSNKRVAALCGPNHAEEVINGLPTATVIASQDLKLAKELSEIFTTPHFKAYPHDDIVGVEICAVVKNVIAIALGISEGLHLGDNASGSLITLSLAEMGRVAKMVDAKKPTSYGLAGVGDLIATCFSSHSRNRKVGDLLAQGKTMDQIKEEMHGMVAEGVKNAKTLYEMCKKNNVEVPLLNQVYSVLYEQKDLTQALKELLDKV